MITVEDNDNFPDAERRGIRPFPADEPEPDEIVTWVDRHAELDRDSGTGQDDGGVYEQS